MTRWRLVDWSWRSYSSSDDLRRPAWLPEYDTWRATTDIHTLNLWTQCRTQLRLVAHWSQHVCEHGRHEQIPTWHLLLQIIEDVQACIHTKFLATYLAMYTTCALVCIYDYMVFHDIALAIAVHAYMRAECTDWVDRAKTVHHMLRAPWGWEYVAHSLAST